MACAGVVADQDPRAGCTTAFSPPRSSRPAQVGGPAHPSAPHHVAGEGALGGRPDQRPRAPPGPASRSPTRAKSSGRPDLEGPKEARGASTRRASAAHTPASGEARRDGRRRLVVCDEQLQSGPCPGARSRAAVDQAEHVELAGQHRAARCRRGAAPGATPPDAAVRDRQPRARSRRSCRTPAALASAARRRTSRAGRRPRSKRTRDGRACAPLASGPDRPGPGTATGRISSNHGAPSAAAAQLALAQVAA